MKNRQVARILYKVAELIDLEGVHKLRAYQRTGLDRGQARAQYPTGRGIPFKRTSEVSNRNVVSKNCLRQLLSPTGR